MLYCRFLGEMSYLMHRVFCAANGDLEAERQASHDIIGDFNEKEAMARGVLFVPVSITPYTVDKRPHQPAIDENIRACSYYVQVIGNTWGPAQKNFERDCALAMDCAGDPGLPMQEVVVLLKRSPDNGPEGLPSLEVFKFTTMEEYTLHWGHLLARWLEAAAPR